MFVSQFLLSRELRTFLKVQNVLQRYLPYSKWVYLHIWSTNGNYSVNCYCKMVQMLETSFLRISFPQEIDTGSSSSINLSLLLILQFYPEKSNKLILANNMANWLSEFPITKIFLWTQYVILVSVEIGVICLWRKHVIFDTI